MKNTLSKEDYIRLQIELDKSTLKHKIMLELFKEIPINEIYKYKLLLPLSYNTENSEFIDISFSEYIKIPTIVEKRHLTFIVPTPLDKILGY